MDIQEKIGQRIREMRIKKGLTQEALAWRSEVDRTYMNHVENGKRNVSVQNLEKIIVNGLESTLKEFFSSKIFASGEGALV